MFSMDIEEFIERGRQGDEDALGSLYKAYHRQMTGICQRIVGNRQVAEELAHDAFLLAFAKMDQLRNPQRFEAWLTSITTNVARRYVQRHHEPTYLMLVVVLSVARQAGTVARKTRRTRTSDSVVGFMQLRPSRLRDICQQRGKGMPFDVLPPP